MSPSGRPTSVGIRLRMCSAIGVKRRIRRSEDTMTTAAGTARQQVDQVGVDVAQLFVAGVELFVDRVELLVGRLQFFLGGIQLLVGALQLLVAREDLLVRRLQLLVRRFQILDDGLQILAAAEEAPAAFARVARPGQFVASCRRRLGAPSAGAVRCGASNRTTKCGDSPASTTGSTCTSTSRLEPLVLTVNPSRRTGFADLRAS